jgi:MinD superfamily P-loop ATPase
MNYSVCLVDCDAEVPNSFIFFPVKKVKEEVVTEYRPVLDRTNCILCGKCAELLGLKKYHAISSVPEERTTTYFAKRPCAKMVEEAARIWVEYMEAQQL